MAVIRVPHGIRFQGEKAQKNSTLKNGAIKRTEREVRPAVVVLLFYGNAERYSLGTRGYVKPYHLLPSNACFKQRVNTRGCRWLIYITANTGYFKYTICILVNCCLISRYNSEDM